MSRRYRSYYVYVMANFARTIYVGVTSNLEARIEQHKRKTLPGFTRRYGLDRLVYYEEYPYIHDAITREKQIKGWLRARKVALIEAANPEWQDLSARSMARDGFFAALRMTQEGDSLSVSF